MAIGDTRKVDENSITAEVDSRLDDLFGEEEKDVTAGVSPDRMDSDRKEYDAEAVKRRPGKESFDKTTPSADEVATVVEKFDADRIERSPIRDLKSIIMSLEWEITDSVMEKLEAEILKLESLYQGDKIVLAFLQLLGSLGKYIRKKLARAHVDAITLLHSAYESLERTILSENMSDGARKKLLITHVTGYKKLKREIQAAGKRTHHVPAVADAAAPPPPRPTDDASFEASQTTMDFRDMSHMAQEIILAAREIQQTLQREFAMLRRDIRRLVEEKE
ncbi:MAG: hypothetical protein RBT16_09735 [Desulfococcus multivorans]|nr:hypothetical protein [Desulfococcus multivorans]